MGAPNIPAMSLPGADSGAGVGYAPLGGMQIDAAGNVTYDFAGHIHAEGVDLDVDPSVAATPDHMIRWLYPNGSEAGHIEVNDPLLSGLSTVQIKAGAAGLPLLESSGNSNLLIWNGVPRKTRFEIFSITFPNVPAGGPTGLNAATPWTTSHSGCALLNIVPTISFGMTIVPLVAGVGTIQFVVSNNPTIQNITITWLTVGS